MRVATNPEPEQASEPAPKSEPKPEPKAKSKSKPSGVKTSAGVDSVEVEAK